MIFEFIAENRQQFKIKRMCELFGVSTSGYYAWASRPTSEHARYDEVLKTAILELHQGFRRCYGAIRMHRELIERGYPCSRRRVNRLMRALGIKASTVGLYQWRPGLHEFYSSTGNLLKSESDAVDIGQQWAGDFTYIKTGTGWLYHAVVLDLYSRRVIGWSFSRQRNSELTKSALTMAVARAKPKPGCLFHSDQGIEYAAHDYRESLEAFGLVRSMSSKGSPLENAEVESFFHTLKGELVHQRRFANEIDAVAHIIEYIEFYNRERRHSFLDYQSPEKYETLCA